MNIVQKYLEEFRKVWYYEKKNHLEKRKNHGSTEI